MTDTEREDWLWQIAGDNSRTSTKTWDRAHHSIRLIASTMRSVTFLKIADGPTISDRTKTGNLPTGLNGMASV
jgi:hypothetical protein